jgi:hypothetical protein
MTPKFSFLPQQQQQQQHLKSTMEKPSPHHQQQMMQMQQGQGHMPQQQGNPQCDDGATPQPQRQPQLPEKPVHQLKQLTKQGEQTHPKPARSTVASTTQPPPSLASTFSATSVAVPFYYHTCPQFTQADMDRERASLSARERADFDGQVAGTAPLPREPAEWVRERLREFDEALEEISLEDRRSYLLAVELQSQEFVWEEVPPVAFLRAEQFDATKAARRCVHYWSFRHNIFGESRAFRPMVVSTKNSSNSYSSRSRPPHARGGPSGDQDNDGDDDDDDDGGGGCMSRVDLDALGKGAAKILPDDARGRPVVFFKRNCVPKAIADHQPVYVRV